MKILLTNDDGIDAPGLQRLEAIARDIGMSVTVVAPMHPHSGVGHRVTTHEPIGVKVFARDRYGLDGTPADCTRIGLKNIAVDTDLLISGINPGANLGSDVYQSGTVAAAREAAILGCPAVAVSQYIARDQTIDWDCTAHHAGNIIRWLLDRLPPPGTFWNVNLPSPLSIDQTVEHQVCELDPHPHKYIYEQNDDTYRYVGNIHERPRDAGKDVAVCFGGKISVTRLSI
jgi:5'-nucleotidase